MQTTTRPTTPAQALKFAIRTGEKRSTVGASTRRLSKLSTEKALRVQALSSELLALLSEGGGK